ncbi:hypothetical protein [Enterococcus faecium]|uniref:hypothetical protein n=1 Tax=Enterococcus TaxID=1350 RepID=UPI000CF16B20|nr:hypothetical protein [Enterococcus faecium]EME8163382.1 hypothetical protein [Enterococcus faecium]PQB58391.1 hypothetical protein CUN35_05880 [Enterococcus faecium]
MRNLSNRNKILIIIVVIAEFHLGTNAVLSRIILGPKPPRPEITRGEFDFRLEYEVDGERIVIEDTIVALFDGFSADAGSMAWYRTWRLHLASDRRSRNILLDELEDGRRIYYVPESANYFMGDVQKEREPNPNWYPFNGVTIEYPRNKTPEIGAKFISGLEDLYDRFGIRLVSWEHDPPIENRFE